MSEERATTAARGKGTTGTAVPAHVADLAVLVAMIVTADETRALAFAFPHLDVPPAAPRRAV
jgi:hypothetical protein